MGFSSVFLQDMLQEIAIFLYHMTVVHTQYFHYLPYYNLVLRNATFSPVYVEGGLARSTHKTYCSGKNKFMSFCMQFGVSDPFPVSQALLCYFVAHLANSGLAYQTIKTYLAAVRHEQISRGLPEPKHTESLPKLKVVKNGVRKIMAVSKTSHLRLPITPTVLRQIRALWSPMANEFTYIMLWAVACTCFFGFF